MEVYREGSGLARRNDVAFSEEDEISRSVSREHAHILRSQENGECRLVNDRIYKGEANCGTYIIRDGFAIAVHRNARGTHSHLGRSDPAGTGLAAIQGQIQIVEATSFTLVALNVPE